MITSLGPRRHISRPPVPVDVAVVGAGPAGLAAAVECARLGARPVVFDENLRPGGQLFKQIHKFFGSKEHKAGTRGFDIGSTLLEDARTAGVDVHLSATVLGVYPERVLSVIECDSHRLYKARCVILATGATENALSFPGWTLPGVMGAGAAQTMINVNRVLPGRRVVMVGTGNVGLIVSYQLLQAGADVACLVEAAPNIGGYGVHAAKVRRAGVPIYLSHSVKEAQGSDEVERVVLIGLSPDWRPVPGTEFCVEADTICLAVGLTPLTELAQILGCEMTYMPSLGGHVPLHDDNMETSVDGVYVAGDIAGVEEASSAMEEGRLAGVSAAESLGLCDEGAAEARRWEIRARLDALRTGPFGGGRRSDRQSLVEKGRRQA